jgi:hypothetical protein
VEAIPRKNWNRTPFQKNLQEGIESKTQRHHLESNGLNSELTHCPLLLVNHVFEHEGLVFCVPGYAKLPAHFAIAALLGHCLACKR